MIHGFSAIINMGTFSGDIHRIQLTGLKLVAMQQSHTDSVSPEDKNVLFDIYNTQWYTLY